MFVNISLLLSIKLITLFNDPRLKKIFFAEFLFVFALLTLLREGIGNDYDAYIYQSKLYLNKFREFSFTWWELRSADGYEYSWKFAIGLAELFHSPKLTILFYDFCSLLFLFLIWRKNNNSEKAIYFLFLFGFHFMMWDQIRQAVGVLILIYAQGFKNGKIKVGLILLSLLFHLSSIILIPFLFLKAARKRFVYILLLITITVLIYQTNISDILEALNLFTREELDLIFEPEHMSFVNSSNFKLRKLLFSLPIFFIAIKLPRNSIGFITLIIGTLFWLLSDGSLNLIRVANSVLYFGICQMVMEGNFKKSSYSNFLAEFIWLVLAIYNISTGSLTQGSQIYNSVL